MRKIDITLICAALFCALVGFSIHDWLAASFAVNWAIAAVEAYARRERYEHLRRD